ncbi:MAG: AAA family ATPase [Phycisphaerales bacterium]|nr:AAA family ATPase [Phycisphaerales bacterium]
MYADFFGLRELPFNNTPDPRFFYSTPDHEEALASLVYAVKERKGFVLLTGEVGAGKTLISRLMLKHFGCTIAFANINHAINDAADLMESLCAEFELPYEPGWSNTQLVRTLHDYLLAKFAQNLPVVLVLDEAQNLSVEGFEQLRMIGNLEADDAKLLQIAIVGQPELRTVFQSPALRQLRQRIFRSFHLPALDRKSTEGYIRHRLAVAGARSTSVFELDAIDLIHQVSRGLPRLINTVCDNAMLSAYSAERRQIDGAFVESVADQMMLPGVDPPGAGARRPVAARYWTAPRAEVSAERAFQIASPRAAAEHTRILPPPAPARGAMQPVERGNEVAELQRRSLDLAAARAAAACEHLNSLVLSANDAVERSTQSQNQLARHEEQIERLVRSVRTVASDLEPLLADLRQAAENGRREQRTAREVHERLGQRIQASREVLEEFSRSSQRLSQREFRVVTSPLAGDGRGGSEIGGVIGEQVREVQPRESSPHLVRMLHVTRESLADLRNLVRNGPSGASSASEAAHQETDSESAEEVAPAMRLVRRMENIAEIVRNTKPKRAPLAVGHGA